MPHIISQNRSDFEFSYPDCLKRKTTHRIRLFENVAWITMLITDMSDKHICPSVTNSIEELVTAFLKERPEISYNRLVIIEHYDYGERSPRQRREETFDLVTLEYDQLWLKFCHPKWKHISKQEAEQWTGQSLM